MIDLNANVPMRRRICAPCGYNTIGERPDVCPFCSASHEMLVSRDAGEETCGVSGTPVADGIDRPAVRRPAQRKERAEPTGLQHDAVPRATGVEDVGRAVGRGRRVVRPDRHGQERHGKKDCAWSISRSD